MGALRAAVGANRAAVRAHHEAVGTDGAVKCTHGRAAPAFTFLATDTSSPFVDTRPNLAAGPESRQYQAQYLDGDDPVGLVSDTVTVIVPG